MKISTTIINFLKETKVELKKVNWPSKPELIKYTIMVIGMSLGVAVFLGGLDFGFSKLLSIFIYIRTIREYTNFK